MVLGLTFGLLICGKHKFSKFAALGGGIGGGYAYRECASEFNKIAHREQRVHAWVNEGKDDFQARMDQVKNEI